MKKLYWRPPGISRRALVLVALVALGALIVVEAFPVEQKQSQYRAKIAAARLASNCMAAIKAKKLRLGHTPDPDVDPAGTGMIGESLTAVTSNTGVLATKQTSTNPNFAAVIVHLLVEAGVRGGDTVAVGVSGSFPALNVATYAALASLKITPIIIASTASSQWGANHVDYVWLDMERTLRDEKLIEFRSASASYGGIDDRGIGITKSGRTMLDAAMNRNGVKKLDASSLADSIRKRMALYEELAGDTPIKAYINVGGGSASVGTHVGKKQFKPGLNTEPPRKPNLADSVMLRFAKRDVPVIHLSRIKLIAQRFALPYAPTVAIPVGQSNVFVNKDYNRLVALIGLIGIFGVMFAFVRWDLGTRMLSGMRASAKAKAPEQMV